MWISITQQPMPEGQFFNTKIEDSSGERNHAKLKRVNNLYFLESGMYIYYTPTHWYKP